MAELETNQAPVTLARYLRDRHEELLDDWRAAAARLTRARELTQVRLLNAMPGMLASIADEVEAGRPTDLTRLPLDEHALDRRRASFDLHDVIAEIALLRDCIFARIERDRRAFTVRELRLLDLALDRVALGAIDYYVATAVHVLATLDELSARTLDAVSLDEAFERLVRAIIEQMPSADFATVLLCEGEQMQVSASVGLPEVFGERAADPVGTERAAAIAGARRSVLFGEPELEGSPLARAGVRALFGAPLLHRGDLVGIAFMGSRNTAGFSLVDRRLFESMAARAAGTVHLQMLRAAAVRKARLLAESQAQLEETLRAQLASERRLRFLARAGHLLARSLEYRTTMSSLAEMVVPEIADLCAVDVLTEDGTLGEHVALAHRDPAKVELARAIRQRYGASPALANILRGRVTSVVSDLTDEILRASATDEEHLRMLRAIGIRSVVVVPLVARDQVFGAISLVQAESGRRFEADDVALAEELARIASTAIDNARLHEETARAVELRDRILALVSHDLKTPLTAIDLSGAVLQQSPRLKEDAFVSKQMDVIRRNAARMSRLIGDLLDMASLQAGRLALEPRSCTVSALLRDAIDSQLPMASEKDVELQLRFALAPDVAVTCDHDRIHQVLANLIGNALKFCGPGGVITLIAEDQGENVVVRVADTGAGIEAEHLPHIFELFWGKGGDRGRKGTGLGLYIARGIVEAHGGRMWVESEPGRGSVFSFTLRRTERADAP